MLIDQPPQPMVVAALPVGCRRSWVTSDSARWRGERGGDDSPLTLLYNDLALLSFSTGSTGDGAVIPWEFQVARFLLPVVVIYGAFTGLIVLFRDRWQQARLPFLRQHVVVIGLGRKGYAFAEALRACWSKVVAIEIDDSNPRVLLARERGITVIIADALGVRDPCGGWAPAGRTPGGDGR